MSGKTPPPLFSQISRRRPSVHTSGLGVPNWKRIRLLATESCVWRDHQLPFLGKGKEGEQMEEEEDGEMKRRRMERVEAAVERDSPGHGVGTAVFGTTRPLGTSSPSGRPKRRHPPHPPPDSPLPATVPPHTAVYILHPRACLLFFNRRPSLDMWSHDDLFLPLFFFFFLCFALRSCICFFELSLAGLF